MFRTAFCFVISLAAACVQPPVCEPDFGLTEGCPVETDTTNPDSDVADSDTQETDTWDTVDPVGDTGDSDTIDTDDTDAPVHTDESDTEVEESDVETDTLVDTAHPCIPAVGWTANCPDTGDSVDTDDSVETDTIDTEETDTQETSVEETDETDETVVDSDSETEETDSPPIETDPPANTDETDTFDTGADTPAETDDTVDSDTPDTDMTDTAIDTETDIDPNQVDNDLDGYTELEGDCEDANPNMYPEERVEFMDWADNDCDGQTDEACDVSCNYDYDSQRAGLGYCRDDLYAFWLLGDLEHECIGHVTYVQLDLDGDGYTSATDCRDWVPSINPGAYDYGNDGVDQNCDGVDQDSGYTLDNDGDGYCEAPACTDGSLPGDCADWIGSVHPDARDWGGDGVDQDCDGQDVDSTWLSDDDLDGYTELEGDCDDGDIDTYPGAVELFDWVDNDCDSHLVGADYGIDETCNTGCNWDYVTYHAGLGYCRDDLYQFWSTDQTGDGDLSWECTATMWYVP